MSIESPARAIRRVAERLSVVGESEEVASAVGRVLAEDTFADRDSPAADVSAMDGYAIRHGSLVIDAEVPVAGECVPGAPPPPMPATGVLRIFTGAIVPAEADTVVKREDCLEGASTVRVRDRARQIRIGAHIRRCGENLRRGDLVVPAGVSLQSPQLAALSNFGIHRPLVRRQVRVAALTTGDELVHPSDSADREIAPWQIRDSNRVAVTSLLSTRTWIQPVTTVAAVDQLDALTAALAEAVAGHDVVILTGGVSMGDYDFVPQAARNIGAETVFHKLPVRPGKPIFAATIDGKLILGLPGNPVSALVGCRRFAVPLIGKIAGLRDWDSPQPMVRLNEPGTKVLPLHWMRLVRMTGDGVAEVVAGKGSGDVVSAAGSVGFVEIPPGEGSPGPWPFYSWAD